MKSNLIMLLTAACLLMCSCSKNNTSPSQVSPAGRNIKPPMKDGGEDDDGPIILEITKDQYNHAVSGALVTLSKESEMRYGYTDNTGKCQLQLPAYGNWYLTVAYNEVTYVNTTCYLPDSFRLRRDTLHLP